MERPQLLYTLRLLRHSIPAPSTSPSDGDTSTAKPPSRIPRLPTLITLFLSQAIRYQTSPAHFLYPLTSRFLLQRPVLDTKDVPMLYSSLYASNEGWKKERGWIVRFLRDGVRSDAVSDPASDNHTPIVSVNGPSRARDTLLTLTGLANPQEAIHMGSTGYTLHWFS